MKTVTVLVVAMLTSAVAIAGQPEPSQAPTRIVVGGTELHYVQQGQGESVVLLHGGQGDYRAWPQLLSTLAPKYRVVSYSRRYHYPNTNPISSDHSAIVDARDLFGLVQSLGLGRVHLVGTSYGALTALAFAIDHPELVRSLALAEPPAHRWVEGTRRGAELFRQFMDTVHRPAARAFASGADEAAMRVFVDAFDARGTFDRLPASRRADVMANALFFKALSRSPDPFPNLSKHEARRLAVPVLLINGADTDELHKAVVAEVANVLPNVRRVEIPNAGHGASRQNPGAFNAAVADFLALVEPAAACSA